MIFATFFLFLPTLWFLPWWMALIVAAIVGFLSRRSVKWALQTGLVCGLVWAALAFIKDGGHGGVISQKMAGLFALPAPNLIFVVIFVLGFITGFLGYQTGAWISASLRKIAT